MRICQKCGSPDNGTGICSNCGSTAFRKITPTNNNGQNNYSNVQRQVPNGYQNNYVGILLSKRRIMLLKTEHLMVMAFKHPDFIM